MGYACPVCGDPQADAGHLANHVAFTAITSGGDHEAWLDERIPEWGKLGEDGLAERIVEYAEAAEYPRVFEASGVDDGHTGGDGFDVAAARDRGSGALDEEARAILERARELTPRRGDDETETTDSSDAAGSKDDRTAESQSTSETE